MKMSVENAYHKVFPVTLFECFDETTSMHFIFSLKKEYKRLEEIIKILRHCGANIGFHKRDITNNSVIITDHNDVIEFYGPAFNIDFITDCLQSGKLQDIGKYRQEITSHLVEERVCMQVVYYRKFGWDSVVKEEDKRWIDLNYKVKLFKDESVISSGSPEVRNEAVKVIKAGQCNCFPSCKPGTSKGQNTNYKSKIESSLEEDECKLAGSKRKGQFQNSSDDGPKVANSGWMSKNSPQVPRIKRNKLPLSLLNIEDSGSEEETKQVTSSKKTKYLYTKEEQYKILNYIVTYNEYSRIKGRELWMIMENKDVCPARTWQSMKEHFIKKIVTNIDSFNNLTNEQKKRIKRAYY